MTRAAIIAALCLLAAPAWALELSDVPTMVIRPDTADMIQTMTERGNKAMDNYDDIAAARLLLKPAADAGSADAALRIAQTYDQVWLVQHHVIGVEGLADFDAMMWWYRAAAKLGDKSDQNRYVSAESAPNAK